MHPDVATATERVVATLAGLAARTDHDVTLAEIEDVLCEGYAHALAGDAWLMRTEQRLQELMADASAVDRARVLRDLVADHGAFQRRVVALRRELAALRAEHDRLRANSRAVA